MESTPAVPAYPVGEEARARHKHQSLLLDYQDLIKETEAKKNALLKANRKKLKLLAEVRFLRGKLKSFSEPPSLKTSNMTIKQSEAVKHKVAEKRSGAGKQTGKVTTPSTKRVRIRVQNQVIPSKPYVEERNFKSVEAPAPGTNALLDLNKDAEELEEWQSLRTDRLTMSSTMTNDLKLPLCRDIGNEASQSGRRKISWQDQLPLRV